MGGVARFRRQGSDLVGRQSVALVIRRSNIISCKLISTSISAHQQTSKHIIIKSKIIVAHYHRPSHINTHHHPTITLSSHNSIIIVFVVFVIVAVFVVIVAAAAVVDAIVSSIIITRSSPPRDHTSQRMFTCDCTSSGTIPHDSLDRGSPS